MIPCEVCGKNPAVYVCQLCGRRVCPSCVDESSMVCVLCQGEKKREESFAPILVGVGMVLVGVLLLLAGSLMGAFEQGAGVGVVIVGPIPIVIGYGSLLLVALLVILAIIVMVASWAFLRLSVGGT